MTLSSVRTPTFDWPSHPQPLKDESVTSWLMRLAQANSTGYRTLLGSCFGDGEWRRKDLDLLSEEWFGELSEAGRVLGGADTLRQMSLTQWVNLVAPTHDADRSSWISSLGETRYCGECLAGDRIPHLRLMWRLHILPVCTKHLSLLRGACWKCGRRQSLSQFYREEGIGTCRHCGARLFDAPPIKPRGCDRLVAFARALLDILDTGQVPRGFGWPYDGREFFRVLKFFIRLLSLKLKYRAKYNALLSAHGLPDGGDRNWRKNEALSCALLEEALCLMEDWPQNVTELLNESQPLFNELAWEYGNDLPASLVKLRATHQGNHRSTRLRPMWHDANREERVKMAVDALLEKDRWIGPVSVDRLSGVSYKTIMKHQALRSIVAKGRDRLLKKRLAEVKLAIDALHGQEVAPASVRDVAFYLGRSTAFIRNSPQLLDFMRRFADSETKVIIRAFKE